MPKYVKVELHLLVVPDPDQYRDVPDGYRDEGSAILEAFLHACRCDKDPEYVVLGELPSVMVPLSGRNPEPQAIFEACKDRLKEYFDRAGKPKTNGKEWDRWSLDNLQSLGLYYYDNGVLTWCSGGWGIVEPDEDHSWVMSTTAYLVGDEVEKRPSHEAPPVGGKKLFDLSADIRLGLRFAMGS